MVAVEDPKASAIDVEIDNMVWEVEDEPAESAAPEEEIPYEEPYYNDYSYEERPARMINKHLFTWLFSFLLGIYGVDRFYRGQIALGVLKVLTFGGFGIWYLVDFAIAAYKSYGTDYGDVEDLTFDINGHYMY